ncbi:MAG TPA: YciI family protein [Methylomirabilota bacterium]|nr:YciI family protein [Methylomirabilota bacterium]
MKYVCLVYLVEKEMEAMSESEADACTDESLAYDDALRRTGQLIVAHALAPVEMATTVRVRKGKLSATDGPFAETTEQLGGFLLIEARDLNEAIQAASRIPLARRGSIEVRPIKELKPSARRVR